MCAVLAIENFSFSNPWRESTFEGEIDNHDMSIPYVIVQKDQERVIGYIILWHIQNEVQISNFAIHPDFRGLGIGKAVMKCILGLISKRGARYILLEVRPSNLEARSLYEKLGFEVWGTRKGYYRNPQEDALIMGKLL